jgi:hypothetical protein
MSIDFLPNRAGPEQRAQAANAAAVRQRLFNAPKRIEAPVQVIEPEPVEPEPLPTIAKPIVRDVLSLSSVPPAMRWRRIVDQVAKKHGVSFTVMKGDNRRKDVTLARFEVCARLYDETGMSLPQIGRMLNKDHSTVFHAIRRHHEIKAGAGE